MFAASWSRVTEPSGCVRDRAPVEKVFSIVTLYESEREIERERERKESLSSYTRCNVVINRSRAGPVRCIDTHVNLWEKERKKEREKEKERRIVPLDVRPAKLRFRRERITRWIAKCASPATRIYRESIRRFYCRDSKRWVPPTIVPDSSSPCASDRSSRFAFFFFLVNKRKLGFFFLSLGFPRSNCCISTKVFLRARARACTPRMSDIVLWSSFSRIFLNTHRRFFSLGRSAGRISRAGNQEIPRRSRSRDVAVAPGHPDFDRPLPAPFWKWASRNGNRYSGRRQPRREGNFEDVDVLPFVLPEDTINPYALREVTAKFGVKPVILSPSFVESTNMNVRTIPRRTTGRYAILIPCPTICLMVAHFLTPEQSNRTYEPFGMYDTYARFLADLFHAWDRAIAHTGCAGISLSRHRHFGSSRRDEQSFPYQLWGYIL